MLLGERFCKNLQVFVVTREYRSVWWQDLDAQAVPGHFADPPHGQADASQSCGGKCGD